MSVILITMAVYFFAMFVQRCCGFGMGIIAIVILPWFVGSFAQTAAYTNVLSAVGALWITCRLRKDVRWKLVFPILAGSYAATFLIVRFTKGMSFGFFKAVLGVVLVALSVYFLFFRGKLSIRPSVRNGVITGICGGTLNGLFAAGGPPVVLYLLGTTESHAVYLATIQGYFVFNNIYAVAVRILDGQFTGDMLPGLGGALAGMVFGIALGDRVGKYIPDRIMLKCIYVLMGISGVVMLL